MEEKNMVKTRELLEKIKKSSRSEFVNFSDHTGDDLHNYLAEILQDKGVTLRTAIDALMMDVSYGYQIFNGRRKPTRNILLRFSLLYHLDLQQTQRILNMGKKNALYARNRFDAAVIFGIEHGYSLEQTEELLHEIGEKTLY